jgi:hypothetical protein
MATSLSFTVFTKWVGGRKKRKGESDSVSHPDRMMSVAGTITPNRREAALPSHHRLLRGREEGTSQNPPERPSRAEATSGFASSSPRPPFPYLVRGRHSRPRRPRRAAHGVAGRVKAAASNLRRWRRPSPSTFERVYALRNDYLFASVNMSIGGGRFFSTATRMLERWRLTTSSPLGSPPSSPRATTASPIP